MTGVRVAFIAFARSGASRFLLGIETKIAVVIRRLVLTRAVIIEAR